MAIAYKSGQRITCLFNDTKPTTLEAGWRAFETDTKLEYYWDGSAWSILNYPLGKKVGWWYANSSGAGLNGSLAGGLGTTVISGTQTKNMDSNGTYANWPTGAVSGNVAGTPTSTLTERDLNPMFFARFRLNTGAHCKLIAGFTTVSTLAIGTTYLDTQSGVVLYFDDNAAFGTGANWRILHNDGVSTQVNDDTSIQADGNIHTIAIVANNATPKFSWQIDTNGWNDITTDIPAATTDLRAVWSIETEEAVAKNADWFHILLVSDK